MKALIALLMMFSFSVHASFDCDKRLSGRAVALVTMLGRAVELQLLSNDDLHQMLKNGEFKNPFTTASEKLLRERYLHAFDGLSQGISQEELADFKSALAAHLEKTIEREAVREDADINTRSLFVPRVKKVINGNEGPVTSIVGAQSIFGYFETRPVIVTFQGYLAKTGRSMLLYDPYNSDPAKQLVRRPVSDKFLHGAMSIVNLPSGDYIVNWELKHAKKLGETKGKIKYSDVALGIEKSVLEMGGVTTIIGDNVYGAYLMNKVGGRFFNLTGDKELPPLESRNTDREFKPLMFEHDGNILAVVPSSAINADIEIRNVVTGTPLHYIYMPSDARPAELRQPRLIHLKGVPYIYFLEWQRAGDDQNILFINALTGEKSRQAIGKWNTIPATINFRGEENLIWVQNDSRRTKLFALAHGKVEEHDIGAFGDAIFTFVNEGKVSAFAVDGHNLVHIEIEGSPL